MLEKFCQISKLKIISILSFLGEVEALPILLTFLSTLALPIQLFRPITAECPQIGLFNKLTTIKNTVQRVYNANALEWVRQDNKCFRSNWILITTKFANLCEKLIDLLPAIIAAFFFRNSAFLEGIPIGIIFRSQICLKFLYKTVDDTIGTVTSESVGTSETHQTPTVQLMNGKIKQTIRTHLSNQQKKCWRELIGTQCIGKSVAEMFRNVHLPSAEFDSYETNCWLSWCSVIRSVKVVQLLSEMDADRVQKQASKLASAGPL